MSRPVAAILCDDRNIGNCNCNFCWFRDFFPVTACLAQTKSLLRCSSGTWAFVPACTVFPHKTVMFTSSAWLSWVQICHKPRSSCLAADFPKDNGFGVCNFPRRACMFNYLAEIFSWSSRSLKDVWLKQAFRRRNKSCLAVCNSFLQARLHALARMSFWSSSPGTICHWRIKFLGCKCTPPKINT